MQHLGLELTQSGSTGSSRRKEKRRSPIPDPRRAASASMAPRVRSRGVRLGSRKVFSVRQLQLGPELIGLL